MAFSVLGVILQMGSVTTVVVVVIRDEVAMEDVYTVRQEWTYLILHFNTDYPLLYSFFLDLCTFFSIKISIKIKTGKIPLTKSKGLTVCVCMYLHPDITLFYCYKLRRTTPSSYGTKYRISKRSSGGWYLQKEKRERRKTQRVVLLTTSSVASTRRNYYTVT
jgi:hypothetical protein